MDQVIQDFIKQRVVDYSEHQTERRDILPELSRLFLERKFFHGLLDIIPLPIVSIKNFMAIVRFSDRFGSI